MKLKIKSKMYLSFGILICFLAGLGLYASLAMGKVNDMTTMISTQQLVRLNCMQNVNRMQSDLRVAELSLYTLHDPAEKARVKRDIEGYYQSITAEYNKIASLVEPSQSGEYSEIKKKLDDYFVVSKEYVALVDQNKTAEAMVILNGKSKTMTDEISAMLNERSDRNMKLAADANHEADVLYESANLYLTVIIFIAIVVSALIAYFFSRQISSAVGEALRVSEKVAQGDLRVTGQISTQDELGTLIRGYNKTVENLKHLIRQIQNTSEQVAASSEQLTASADQSAQVTQQIAQNIGEVSGASDDQLHAVEKTAQAIEKISAGVEEVSANLQMSAGNAEKAASRAHEGTLSIEKAIVQMNTIDVTVTNSSQVVMTLGERSKEIGQIVETISGIAGQTNLLALNAAIEAARAGEMGKGFAVVAEEVRKLAEQSQEAAEKIATLISSIQGETEKAVAAMEEGTKEVKLGAEVVNEAGTAFTEIAQMAASVSKQVKGISETMDSVSGRTEEIVDSIQSIDRASRNVSGEAQTVAAATQEQSAAMEEIAASSKALAGLAQGLQEEAHKFTI